MKILNVIFTLSISAIGGGVSLVSAAQGLQISDCQAITDRAQRFDCYDALEAAAAPSTNASPATASPSRSGLPVLSLPSSKPANPAASTSPVPSEVQQDVDSFGKASSARLIADEDGEQVLLDKVVALKQFLPNRWQITLESGQTWRQMTSKKYFLKKGEEVKIYPSIWGEAFRLRSDRLEGFIQVERVD